MGPKISGYPKIDIFSNRSLIWNYRFYFICLFGLQETWFQFLKILTIGFYPPVLSRQIIEMDLTLYLLGMFSATSNKCPDWQWLKQIEVIFPQLEKKNKSTTGKKIKSRVIWLKLLHIVTAAPNCCQGYRVFLSLGPQFRVYWSPSSLLPPNIKIAITVS